jgi:hypothetical protein
MIKRRDVFPQLWEIETRRLQRTVWDEALEYSCTVARGPRTSGK